MSLTLFTHWKYKVKIVKISEKINNRIARMPLGTTFKYQQLGISNNEYGAAAKAIERLIAKKIIKRISTGVFYKPRQTAFGELVPGEEEQLRPYLFIGKKRIAYITGTALYNRMGLTTQIPKDIRVASKVKEIRTRVGNRTVRRVKSYMDVTNENYRLLEILDALKDFKQIPDLDKKAAVKQIRTLLSSLNRKARVQLVRYALKYPPRTRAFLGALLESITQDTDLILLEQSLNPLTNYDLGIPPELLSTAQKWNIK
jgi:hypothetical protein